MGSEDRVDSKVQSETSEASGRAALKCLAAAIFVLWLAGIMTGCLPDSGTGQPESSEPAGSEFGSVVPPPVVTAPPPPPQQPPRVARPDAPDVAPATGEPKASPIISQDNLRRQPPAAPEMPYDQQPAGVVSWEVKPDPPVGQFQYEITGKYQFPLDRGVEVIATAVPSHFLLLASRSGFSGFHPGRPQCGCASFDLRTGKPAAMIKDDEFADSRGPIAISPDGVHVVDMKFMENDLRVWSLREGVLSKRIPHENRQTPEVAFFIDPTRLLLAGGMGEHQVEILSVETGQTLLSFTALADRSNHIKAPIYAVSPGGNHLFIAEGQTLYVFDLKAGREIGRSNVAPLSSHGMFQWVGLAFRSDGGQVAGVGYSSDRFRVACWDTETGRAVIDYVANLPRMAHRHSQPESLVWLPDTNLLLAGATELIDAATGNPLGPLPGAAAGTALAIDSRRFVTMPAKSSHHQGAIAVVTLPGEEKIAQRRTQLRNEEAAGPKLTAADLSKASRLQTPATSVDWTARFAPCETPDGLLPKPLAAGKSGLALRSVAFNKSDPQTIALVHGATQPKKALPQLPPRLQRQQAQSAEPSACWIEAFSLVTGDRTARISLPGFYNVLGLSMDATLAVLGLEDTTESQSFGDIPAHVGAARHSGLMPEKSYERLDIWSLETGNHALGFRPYASESRPEDRLVTWCAFLDKRHALTTNQTGLLVKWEFPSCQAEYALEGFGQVAALSPDRRYVIGWMPQTDVLRVVNTQNGQCEGELYIGKRFEALEAAAISACGLQFAAIVRDRNCQLVTWELDGGTLVHDMVFSSNICGKRPSLVWVDPSYVMVAGRYLLDLERSTTAWQYTLDQGVVANDSCDDRLWYLMPGSGGAVYRLEAASLPNADVRQKTADLELGDQVTFRPGVPVSLSVQVSVSGVNDAEQVLNNALRSQGVPVQPSADLVLEYRAGEKSTGEQTEYRTIMGGGREDPGDLTVNEKAIEITVRLAYRDGLELWSTKDQMQGYASMMVHGSPQEEYNRSLQQHFNGALHSFKLPAYLFLPPEKLGAGFSRLDR